MGPLIADGLGLDRALAALFCGAKAGETISLVMARGQEAKRRWPCFVCKVLHWIVERGHCPNVLAGLTTSQPAALRAGALMLALILAAASVPVVLWGLLVR